MKPRLCNDCGEPRQPRRRFCPKCYERRQSENRDRAIAKAVGVCRSCGGPCFRNTALHCRRCYSEERKGVPWSPYRAEQTMKPLCKGMREWWDWSPLLPHEPYSVFWGIVETECAAKTKGLTAIVI
jgi:hypothetical protein